MSGFLLDAFDLADDQRAKRTHDPSTNLEGPSKRIRLAFPVDDDLLFDARSYTSNVPLNPLPFCIAGPPMIFAPYSPIPRKEDGPVDMDVDSGYATSSSGSPVDTSQPMIVDHPEVSDQSTLTDEFTIKILKAPPKRDIPLPLVKFTPFGFDFECRVPSHPIADVPVNRSPTRTPPPGPTLPFSRCCVAR